MALALRRQDDAVQLFRLALEVVWCANVIATVRRGLTYNFGLRDGNPGSVDLHLIMSIDGPAGSRTTVGEVATRAFAIGALQHPVEALMPLVVARPEITLLCVSRKGQSKKQNNESRTHGSLIKRPVP